MKLLSFRAKCSAYLPDGSQMEGDWIDDAYDSERGARDPDYKAIHTLHPIEDFLDGKAPHVSVAMDKSVLPWGTLLTCPDFNAKWGMQIPLKAVDTGGRFFGKKFSKIDICTNSTTDEYSQILNIEHDFVALQT